VRTEIVLAVVLAVACVAVAGESPVLVVVAPPAVVKVGDRVPVRVTARGGEELLWGELQVSPGVEQSWAVVDGPREVAGARPPAWELALAPMEIGDIPLPEITVSVRSPGGAARQIAVADRPAVKVASVLPEGDDVQPAPLHDPLGVSGFPWEWVLPAMVPALALAVALTWWGRRRNRVGEGRVGREPAEGVCDRLAVGLRHYLERRCGEPAEEMTSFELRLLTRRLGWPESIQRGVQSVMGTADRVRFGRFPTGEEELRRAIAIARDTGVAVEEHLRPDQEESAIEEAAG
jgi:hypothetical protein